jgi:hypothetical protein
MHACIEAVTSDDIGALTGRLLIADPCGGKVSVAHRTLAEYLEEDSTRECLYKDISTRYHSTILRFITPGFIGSDAGLLSSKEFVKQFPLYYYALDNWRRGLASILEQDTPLWDQTKAFFGSSAS